MIPRGPFSLVVACSALAFLNSCNGDGSGDVTEPGAAGTLTTITLDTPDPSVAGQPVAVTVGVTSTEGVPAGDVTVSVVGGTESCSATLSNGTATCSLTLASEGAQTLTATYEGNADFVPSSDTEPHTVAPAQPGSSQIQITTTTTGSDLDADGYEYALDGGPSQAIAVNATATITDVAPGAHTLVLAGVAPNCIVAEGASRAVTVAAGATATVSFAVACTPVAPTVGSLRVTTNTSGPDPDPNGYQFSLDGGQGQSIGVNGTRTIGNVPAGAHTVQLSGVAGNCTVDDESKSATVTPGATATVAFNITCAALPPTTGSIRVTTTTTGLDQDPDGYRFSIDGGQSQAIGVEASVTVSDVPAGDHVVRLSGVASNCSVGDDSETATVTAGATATVAFQVTCAALPPTQGAIRVTTSTTGASLDPNGYQFAIDGRPDRTIGVNATETVANIPAGSHTVRLSGVAPNCDVAGGASQAVTVRGGQTSGVAFSITCTATGPSPTRSTVLANPRSIPTGSNSTITVTVRDAGNAPVAGTTVTLDASGSGNTIAPASATTNASGVATFTFRSTVTGNKTISATAGGVTLEETEVISVFARGSTTEITSITPETSSPGESIEVTVSVIGEGGGTPTGTVTIFSNIEAAGCEAPISAGTATCDFALNDEGTHTINATYSGDSQFEESFADGVEHEVVAPTTTISERSARRGNADET